MIKPYFPDAATYFGRIADDPDKSCLTCLHHDCVIKKDWPWICAEYLPIEKITVLHSIAKQKGEPYEENKQ